PRSHFPRPPPRPALRLSRLLGEGLEEDGLQGPLPAAGAAERRRLDARGRLKRDAFSSNRHPALDYCWSMMFFRKPVPTFRHHALSGELTEIPRTACPATPARPLRSGTCATGSAARAYECRGSAVRTGSRGKSRRRPRPCTRNRRPRSRL